jgi:hypothetical protein
MTSVRDGIRGPSRNRTIVWGVGILVVSRNPARRCVESNFELAPESRIPIYYAPPSEAVDNTVLVAKTRGERQEFSGHHWWHPQTQRQLDAYYATEPRPAYPSPAYVAVKVGEQIDVIEHREYEQNRDPTRAQFWMATDRAILQEARQERAR